MGNLKTVLNGAVDDKMISVMANEVFRNFAKYLVDFFRLQKVDREYVDKNVKVEGQRNIDEARSAGKGVIMLSAHLYC
jgi:lauroyl/myristoyl acyltransferase